MATKIKAGLSGDTGLRPSHTRFIKVSTAWLRGAAALPQDSTSSVPLGSWLPRVRNFKELGGAVFSGPCWRKLLLHSF